MPIGVADPVQAGVIYPMIRSTTSQQTFAPETTISADATPNDFMDLERDLTQCISSNPLPGCGREPTSPGDRGGWQQFLLFGIMVTGMGIIFWRVGRSIRARDRVVPAGETEKTRT